MLNAKGMVFLFFSLCLILLFVFLSFLFVQVPLGIIQAIGDNTTKIQTIITVKSKNNIGTNHANIVFRKLPVTIQLIEPNFFVPLVQFLYTYSFNKCVHIPFKIFTFTKFHSFESSYFRSFALSNHCNG